MTTSERADFVSRYADYLRWLYKSGRPNAFARLQNRASAAVFAVGLMPNRAAMLEVRGRLTGRIIKFPVVIADVGPERFVVSMLGAKANWVSNVRAAGGRAVLRHGRRESVHLEEVPARERAPILRRYLQVAPGARPHMPINRNASLAELDRVAEDYPVFRVGDGHA
jgi:deazaflavin-dependent oxidoreductase (nitroreductase family)